MRTIKLTLIALFITYPALAGNEPIADPTTGKKGDTIGQSFNPSTGKWGPTGQTSASGGGSGEFRGWRKRAIWNSLELAGLHTSPQGTAPVPEYAGAIAYDVFTTPEVEESLELVAHLRIGGGYSAEQNRMFDLILALGGGVQFGPVAFMALAAFDMDSIWGNKQDTLREPVGLAWGPELRAQAWLVDWASIDVSAARFYKLTGSRDDGSDLPNETRVGAMLSLVPGGNGWGVSFGAQYTDYGLGSATMAIAALRLGAR